MRTKRFLATGLILLTPVVVMLIGLTSSEFIASACACATVNEEVIWGLDDLEVLIQGYAAEHNGLFPTYDELVALAAQEKWIQARLTPEVDLDTGAFTFSPGRDDARKLGYAVSVDRSQYLLLGIGWNEKYKDTYFFGRWLGRKIVGHEYPILQPGDTPPEPSPPS